MQKIKSMYSDRTFDLEITGNGNVSLNLRGGSMGADGIVADTVEFAEAVAALGIPGLTYKRQIKAPTGLGAVVELPIGSHGGPQRFIRVGKLWYSEGDAYENATDSSVSQWLTLKNATIISKGVEA